MEKKGFCTVLRNLCGIGEKDRILVGVSGGMDSLFLLEQFRLSGQPVTAAVYDHGLRQESAAEADFVERFCAERGIPCLRGVGNVSGAAREMKLPLEAAARKMRYAFLFGCAEQTGAAALATAHHADDQAETILLHLLRGCGTDGLCGMSYRALLPEFHETIPLIRPLLAVSRAEIEAWFHASGLPHAEDASNRDTRYLRNRIRWELLPELERYNPEIRSSLGRLSCTAALDRDLLDDLTECAWRRICLASGSGFVELDRAAYCAEKQGLRLRLLRKAAMCLAADPERFGMDHYFRGDDFWMGSGENARLPWLGGLTLERTGASLSVFTEGADPLGEQYPLLAESPLALYGEPVRLSGGTLFCSPLTEDPDLLSEWLKRAKRDKNFALLDADRLKTPLRLRKGEPGERFIPFGMKGSKKLSDFWVDEKIPQSVRADHALLCDEEGIVWIPGIRAAARCAVRPETVRVRAFLWAAKTAGTDEIEWNI